MLNKNDHMPDFQKPIAPYLIEKKNIVNLILFTALFALVFINIYSPFGADRVQPYPVPVLYLFKPGNSNRCSGGCHQQDNHVQGV